MRGSLCWPSHCDLYTARKKEEEKERKNRVGDWEKGCSFISFVVVVILSINDNSKSTLGSR